MLRKIVAVCAVLVVFALGVVQWLTTPACPGCGSRGHVHQIGWRDAIRDLRCNACGCEFLR